MPAPPLACTVRGCGEPLLERNRSYVCARGHAYDVARSGYVNLLQPQDRKSSDAGDLAAAIDARAFLVDRGIGHAVLTGVVTRAGAVLSDRPHPVVCDLGCGSGDALGRLNQLRPICGVGIDLSTHATTLAARRFGDVTWVVANADRRLPLLDASVDLVLSVHARRNPSECHRILAPGGLLLVAIPAVDDLIELRAAVQGEAVERDRAASLVSEHESAFTVVDRWRASEQADVDRVALAALLRGTYRGVRFKESVRAGTLERLRVTLASDIVLLRPR